MRGTRHGGRLRHHAKAALGQYTLPMALFAVDRVTLTYTVRFDGDRDANVCRSIMMGSEILAGQCLHSCPPQVHRRRSPALSQALRASSKPDNVPPSGERLCCRTVLIAVTVLELSALAGAPLFELGLLGGTQSQQQ